MADSSCVADCTPSWIEWFDLDVLRNIVGVWVMGERGVAFEFIKMDLRMNHDGSNKLWRAQIHKGKQDSHGHETINIYGLGEWKLMYPTSIEIRQNIYHLCNYYANFYKINMRLSRDVINVIGDFTLGIGVRSWDMIEMRLILNKESFRHVKRDWGNQKYSFRGYDVGEDFNEQFGMSVANSLVDLLSYCTNEVENKQDNKLEEYENIMKLDSFTDNEEDDHFNQYFKCE